MTKLIKLGVSGEAGSFSEEAGLVYAKSVNVQFQMHYLIDMEGVLAAIESKVIDWGIFPVVNMHGGLVRMAFDAMGKYSFKVIDELWFPVQHFLLAKPDVSLQQINRIYSHSQGLLQCRHYLQRNFDHMELIEWQDTAKAAKELAQGILTEDSAVIAPQRAASIYKLQILAEHIQDESPNLTAFIIVKNLGEL